MAKNKGKSNNTRNQQSSSGSRTSVKSPPAPKLAREETMQRGILASEAGEKDRAYGIFQEVAKAYPDALEAWVWLGWSSPTLDASEKAFKRAFALDPTNEEAAMGMRWVQSQRDEEATASGDEPLAEEEADPPANRTSPHLDATADAENNRSSSRTSGILAEPHTVLWSLEEGMQHGISALEHGDKLVAYSTFQQMTSKYPDAVDTWVWLGGTCPSLEEAEAAFVHARALEPNNEMANLGLRWAELRRGSLAQQGSTTGTHQSNITGGLDMLTPPGAAAEARPAAGTKALSSVAGGAKKSFAGPLQPLIDRWGGGAVAIIAVAVVVELLILLWLLLGLAH